MKRTNRSKPKTPQLPPQPSAPEAAAPEAAQPPPGQMDLDAARYWAGRGPKRKNRPPYSLRALDD
jgi:hypothetical protein